MNEAVQIAIGIILEGEVGEGYAVASKDAIAIIVSVKNVLLCQG